MRVSGWLGARVFGAACLQLLACGHKNELTAERLQGTPAGVAPPSPVGVIAQITGAGAAVTYLNPPVGTHTADLTEAGRSYWVVEQPYVAGNTRPARLPLESHRLPEGLVFSDLPGRPTACRDGAQCLLFAGYSMSTPPPPANETWLDRLELEVEDSDAGNSQTALRLVPLMDPRGRRYLRFALKVAGETKHLPDDAGADTIICQVWQNKAGFNNVRPAFTIYLAGDPDPNWVNLNFAYSNDTDALKPFHTERIAKEAWQLFHIELRPHAVESGLWQTTARGWIKIWMNEPNAFAFGADAATQSRMRNNDNWRFDWGYRASGQCGVTPECLTNRFSTRVGQYRNFSAKYGGLGRAVTYVDSIKLTDTTTAMPGL